MNKMAVNYDTRDTDKIQSRDTLLSLSRLDVCVPWVCFCLPLQPLYHTSRHPPHPTSSPHQAAEVNGQWRQYHEQRQQYVQRLLTTLHDLQHPRAATHSPRQVRCTNSSKRIAVVVVVVR